MPAGMSTREPLPATSLTVANASGGGWVRLVSVRSDAWITVRALMSWAATTTLVPAGVALDQRRPALSAAAPTWRNRSTARRSGRRRPPARAAGAQIKRFQQARSPTGHQAEPGQLESRVGAWEHGAANQVKPPPAESAAALGGQAEIEQGVEPNWQVVAAQAAPPPVAHVPVEKPAWLTNSSVTSPASSSPPLS